MRTLAEGTGNAQDHAAQDRCNGQHESHADAADERLPFECVVKHGEIDAELGVQPPKELGQG